MKLKYFIFLLAMVLVGTTQAQQTISKANEKVILTATMNTVQNYTKYLELIADEVDKDLVQLYKAELLKSVEKDSILVYNDLIPEEDREKTIRENIDRLATYIDDINSRYLEGVLIVYKSFNASRIYLDTARQRLFVKVSAERELSGTYYYKNQKKEHKNTATIDFYVGIQLRSNGVPESRIYSIFQHNSNEDIFIPVDVVEKTAPIEFVGMNADTTYVRDMSHMIRWKGGEIFERLSLSIYEKGAGLVEDELVHMIDSSFINDSRIQYRMPKKIKPGKKHQYYFKVQKLGSKEAPTTSEVFHIKRRIPMIYQVGVPTVVVGGLGYLIYSLTLDKPEEDMPGAPRTEDFSN